MRECLKEQADLNAFPVMKSILHTEYYTKLYNRINFASFWYKKGLNMPKSCNKEKRALTGAVIKAGKSKGVRWGQETLSAGVHDSEVGVIQTFF